MKSQAERQTERRKAKLADIERDVARGSLVIRKMTAAERAKYPPRQRGARRRGG